MPRRLMSDSAIRIAGLLAGFMGNFALLRWAFEDLGPVEFGALALVTNATFIVQNLDLGLRTAIVNRTATLAYELKTFANLELLRWLGSVWCVSAIIASVCLLVAVVWLPVDLKILVLVLPLAVAVASNGSSLASSVLVGKSRTTLYYVLALAQPAVLVTLGAIVHSARVGSIVGYATIIAFSAIAPGALAFLLMSRPRRRERVSSAEPLKSQQILGNSAPLGVRQLTGLLAFGVTPLLAGAVGGEELAGRYAVPFRIFVAAWSVVGVIYMRHWASMSRALRTPEHQKMIASAVTKLSLLVATPLGVMVIALGPTLSRFVDPSLADEMLLIYVLVAVALVFRACSTGWSLQWNASQPAMAPALMEAAIIGSLVLLTLKFSPAPTEINPALSLAVAGVGNALFLFSTVHLRGR